MVQITRRNKVTTGLFWWWSENDRHLYTGKRSGDMDHGLLSMLIGRDVPEERRQDVIRGRYDARSEVARRQGLLGVPGKLKVD